MRILDETGAEPPGAQAAVAGLFAARYPELVRLAGLLGADDPEDIAQEAFARLLRSYGSLRDANAALAYVRATVCNLTRNSSLSGVAAPGVTSVTAVLADGRKYTGTLVHGKGFSYPVWLVSYPLKDPATLVFRDAAGKEVAVLHEPANP